jgi:hypothetical protein
MVGAILLFDNRMLVQASVDCAYTIAAEEV